MKFLAKNDTIFGIDICVDDASRPFYCAENGTSLSIRELNDPVQAYFFELPAEGRFLQQTPAKSVALKVILWVRNESGRFKFFGVTSSNQLSSYVISPVLPKETAKCFNGIVNQFKVSDEGDFILSDSTVTERADIETLSTSTT